MCDVAAHLDWYLDNRRGLNPFDEGTNCGYPRECYTCEMASSCQTGFYNPAIQDKYFYKNKKDEIPSTNVSRPSTIY